MKTFLKSIVLAVSLASAGIAHADSLACAGSILQVLQSTELRHGQFQIGFEAEYLFDETAAILRDYAPKTFSTENWKSLSDDERVNWLKTTFKKKPEYPQDAQLILINKLSFPRPSQVIIDSTGNLELVMPPVNSYKEWEAMVDAIAARYGVGSQQAMVSIPRDVAFQNQGKVKLLGWLTFTNFRDMFSKLKQGYGRYQEDPSKLTALSFEHPYLGPMTKIKRDEMARYLEKNALGELYDEASKAFVRRNDASFKYTGGPAYRPDIAGPARFSWEIRNAHRDLQDLKMKVQRDIVAFSTSLDAYEDFASVPAFDSVEVFMTLPDVTRQGLAKIFISKVNNDFELDENEQRSLETFRNFSLPLGDFSTLVDKLSVLGSNRTELLQSLIQAQRKYRFGLINTVAQFEAGTLDRKNAAARIMGLLGQWAVESGLAESFDRAAEELRHEPSTKDIERAS